MRILLSFIFFCSTVFANHVFAQDIFELTYQFKGDNSKTVYRGLCFKNPDGTGFLRLTATNAKTKKRVLYDFSFSLNEYDQNNHPLEGGVKMPDASGAYWYCWSENYDIKEGKEIFPFDYLRIWFKEDEATKMIVPCTQTPFIAEGRYLGRSGDVKSSKRPAKTGALQTFGATEVLSFKPISNTALIKTYLAAFFTSSELKSEGVYTTEQILAARNNIKPVIFLISLVNTGDKDIMESCIADSKNVSSYFTRVANYLGLPINIIKIDGNNFNVNAVLAAIKNIPAKADDIIVFHYAGHGFSYGVDERYPFPELALYYGDAPTRDALRGASINMERIFTEIKSKGARLNLVLSDCCNTELTTRRYPVFDKPPEQFPPGYFDMNRRPALSLFLQAKGSMLISASKKGQPANCSNAYNGFFSTSMVNAIRLELKGTGEQQWINVIKRAKKDTFGLAFLLPDHRRQDIIYKIFCDTKDNTPCLQDLGNQAIQAGK